MKRASFILALMMAFIAATPSFCENKKANISLKTRLSFNAAGSDYNVKCDYLRVSVKGEITEGLTYIFQQRFNKPITDGNFLSATDYIYLRWIRNGWEFSGGKYYVACGGFDYNSSSYDIYLRPEYFDGCAGMYNYIVNVARHFKRERLCFQMGNSLYASKASNLLGFSINLTGAAGIWEHMYSVNLFEREKGKTNLFFCLGNRFHTGIVDWDLGLMHRMDTSSPSAFKDFTAIIKAKAHIIEKLDIFCKTVWDYKEDVQDPVLPDWTNVKKIGAGLELYPFKSIRGVRLHCVYFYDSNRTSHVMAGFSWNLSLL